MGCKGKGNGSLNRGGLCIEEYACLKSILHFTQHEQRSWQIGYVGGRAAYVEAG